MSYCTAEQVVGSLGDELLADMLGVEVGALSGHAAIAEAITVASSRIDSYLAQAGYALPITVESPTLSRAALDMAVYYLFSARRQGDIEDILTRYQEHINWLVQVAAGRAKIAELSMVGVSITGEVVVVAASSGIAWGGY